MIDLEQLFMLEEEAKAQMPSTNAKKILILISELRKCREIIEKKDIVLEDTLNNIGCVQSGNSAQRWTNKVEAALALKIEDEK